MKTRTLVSISIPILFCLLLFDGCATTARTTKPTRLARITEPTHAGSVLLVGRIKATCEEFEQRWNMNGEHTDDIEIDIRNLSTNEITSIRSKGAYGVFYLNEAEHGVYAIERISYTSHGGRSVFNLYHLLKDGVVFAVEEDGVYNLGDIEWYAKCKKQEAKDYSRKGSETVYEVETMHYYQQNFNELKAWFKTTYPDSSWSKRNWINVEYVTRQRA